MSTCPHTPKYPDVLAVPSLQDALSRVVPADAESDPELKVQRALTNSQGQTRVDNTYWQGLSDAQRAALAGHEIGGHTSSGQGFSVSCEGCADKMGGYFMRAWGYAPSVVQQSYQSLKVKRKAGQGTCASNAAEGAQAAEHAMMAKGLSGLSSTAIAQLRAKQLTSASASGTPPLASATTIDPGGPPTAAQEAVAPPNTQQLNGSGTADATSGASAPTVQTTNGTDATVDHSGGFAGDVVASVLGEDARPHAVPVLIGAAVAATLAVILVIIVRHAVK
jgi:hypothetical protein